MREKRFGLYKLLTRFRIRPQQNQRTKKTYARSVSHKPCFKEETSLFEVHLVVSIITFMTSSLVRVRIQLQIPNTLKADYEKPKC